MARTLRFLLLSLLTSLVWATAAQAKGGNYTFEGGTAQQRAQVRAALEVSSFDWSVVPALITIHVHKGTDTYAKPGEIWIDADLLNSGSFAWGPIQHEFAHQVDFFCLDDAKRAQLNRLLGGVVWSTQSGELALGEGVAHGSMGAERFASTLAWSFWQATANSLRPQSPNDEAAALDPTSFRRLVARVLGVAPAVAAGWSGVPAKAKLPVVTAQ